MSSQPHSMQGIAPIFGKDLCCFIASGANIRLPLHDLGSQLLDGFFLGIDVQPEGSHPSVLLGTGVSSKTSLVIHYNADSVKNRIRLDLSDDNGRTLSAWAQLSKYAAKRLIISVDVQQDVVNFYEFNILPTDDAPPTQYSKCDRPRSFSNFTYEMMVGGRALTARDTVKSRLR